MIRNGLGKITGDEVLTEHEFESRNLWVLNLSHELSSSFSCVGRVREMVVVVVQETQGRGAAVTLLWSLHSDLVIIIMPSQKAKGKQVVETVDEDDQLPDNESGGSEHDNPADEPAAQTSSKGKKKKKSKLNKLLNPISGNVEEKILESVLEKVGPARADVDEDSVRAALQQLKLKDVIAGKSGLGGKNQKDTGGHKVRDYRVF